MARGKPKKAGWFTAERGGERMRQSFHRASHSTGITDSDLAVLAAVFSLTVGHSKLDDEPTLPQIATELGRWERPTPDDPRTPEQIEKARGKKTDRVGASLQKLAAVGSIVYEPGRGGRRSYIALPPVDDADSQPPATRGVGDVEQDRDRSSQPPAARGVGGTRDGTLNPPRRGPQPPAARSSTPRGAAPNPPREGGTTDRSDRSDRTESGSIDPDAHVHARQLKSADRAAELLTSLAPVASHPEETAREARRVATLVVQHVDRDVFAEALDEIGGPRTPASFLALFGSWLTEREIAAGAILEPIGDNLDEYPAAAAIADACTLTSRGSWTAHFDEAVRVARHFEHHDYPPAIIAEVLAEIRRDGLRHPGDADTLAQQKILELGHHPPKKFTKATARKTA